MQNKKNKEILILSSLLIVLLVWLIPGMIRNKSIFMKNTIINGVNVSGLDIKSTKEKIENSAIGELTIKKRDGKEEKLSLEGVVKKDVSENSLATVLGNQRGLLWPKYMLLKDKHNINLKSNLNKDQLDKKIASMNMIINPAIQDPQDAYVKQTDTGFQIEKEVTGNRVELEKLKNIIYMAIENGEDVVDLANQDVYKKPKITSKSPEILAQLEGYKKFEGIELTVDFVNANEKLNFQNIKDYLSFNQDGEMVFNDDAMYKAFESYANKYNTFGKVRDFNATNIGPIKVGGSSTDSYGFQLDIRKTMDAVKEAFKNNKKEVVAVWKIPALVRSDAGDIGNTYIEVDLTRQHMWYYVDGKLALESDFVSGKSSTPTPVGLNRVWHKEMHATLTGPGYRQPVTYWMPFNWVDCGFHDAGWRRGFGGQIYQSGGSHGCINMPPAKAKALYNMVKLDTPVIVYKS